MDSVILLGALDGLHGLSDFATIAVLDDHLYVGKDCEGELCLRYYHPKCSNFFCFGAHDFDVGAAFSPGIEWYKAEYFEELVKHISSCWSVGPADG